ncbi:MAG: metallopeptidase family protein [Ignavibacteriales bacterium]|nr:metallopeptidase family protein [Ignavibacteriales bacterium]
MTREQFEEIAQHAFDSLPDAFKHKIENVQIVVEDYPSGDALARTRAGKFTLLGLYQGVPLPHRGTSYGMYPVGPDKISLYQKNIEQTCSTEQEIERRIVEVLFHELGHYFGMNEQEVRDALRDFE